LLKLCSTDRAPSVGTGADQEILTTEIEEFKIIIERDRTVITKISIVDANDEELILLSKNSESDWNEAIEIISNKIVAAASNKVVSSIWLEKSHRADPPFPRIISRTELTLPKRQSLWGGLKRFLPFQGQGELTPL
jgi:hypothetical protein